MSVKLIGINDSVPAGYDVNNYQVLNRFAAEATGSMTEFKVKCNGNGTVIYAVYADSSGTPAARLFQQTTPQSVVSGWNTLEVTSVSLTSGTYYWLAALVNAEILGYLASGGTRKYKLGASTFPDPFNGTGFSSDSALHYLAGWGTISGWGNVSKIGGIAAASISKIDGVAVANIAKIDGVAV